MFRRSLNAWPWSLHQWAHVGKPLCPPPDFGAAVAAATPSREWAAFLVTVASHESALSERIARSDCHGRECDNGRAWGLWQQHRTVQNAADWGSPDLTVQARHASRLARGYYNMCRSSGVPFPLSTFRAYAGRGCLRPLKGEDERMATYQRVLRRL